jgi:ribosomal protein L11 methylase PrmA
VVAPFEQKRLGGSFRDPSGFVFKSGDQLMRQINFVYQDNYDFLISSGLYSRLTKDGLLVEHEELRKEGIKNCYLTISPNIIPFISYPYEWSFSQLRDAALLTLNIQKIALEHSMTLKDASAYNIQFVGSNPIFIDTLSFERYKEDRPWVAYRQFVEHFLAPLLLMSYLDVKIHKLQSQYINGLPLDLVSSLLPLRSYFSFAIVSHVHAHARMQKRFSEQPSPKADRRLKKFSLLALIDNLHSFVSSLSIKKNTSHWQKYYSDTNYSEEAFTAKEKIVLAIVNKVKPKFIWDIGCNTGRFSFLAASEQSYVVSMDADFNSVEVLSTKIKQEKHLSILPLVIDFCNPTPAIGWNLVERHSLFERGPADLVMALALIHHLAIGNNVPFSEIAKSFAQIAKKLIVEFVPKTDSQVVRLLQSRADIFPDYNEQRFIACMEQEFVIDSRETIPGSERVIFYMLNRNQVP